MNKNSLSGYIEINGKKIRFIPDNKVVINKYTPRGDDPIYYESKPYGGKRYFYPNLHVKENKVDSLYWVKTFVYKRSRWEYNPPKNLIKFLEEKNIVMPSVCKDGVHVALT